MSNATALNAVPATNPLSFREVIAAWRGITRAQVRTTFVLACILCVYTFVVFGIDWRLAWLTFTFIVSQIKAFAILLGFAVAERVTGGNPDRRGVYALALVAGAAVGAFVAVSLASHVLWPLLFGEIGGGFKVGFMLYFFLDLALIGGAAVWVINDRRRAARARALMHRAEQQRIEARKQTIESELQAMQARVEPQFLFNTLAQVRRLYERDTALAERMLDELIAYLHAAMPKMRDSSSTVGQEIELVRAYLAILKVPLGDRLALEFELPADRSDARLPPMLLLPLIDHATAHGLVEPQAKRSLRVRASVADTRIRLEIADSAAGFAPEREGEGVAAVRERLTALYGAEASLVLRNREAGATEAIVEVPCEARWDFAEGLQAIDSPMPGV